MLFFDFANKYVFEHQTIKAAKDFVLTEAEYTEFVTWLKGKNYNYSTQVEKDLSSLEASAKKEKYMDGIQEQFAALKTKIANQRKGDINLFKNEIKDALEKNQVL
jgi:carboxyl-terminal processing protease